MKESSWQWQLLCKNAPFEKGLGNFWGGPHGQAPEDVPMKGKMCPWRRKCAHEEDRRQKWKNDGVPRN